MWDQEDQGLYSQTGAVSSRWAQSRKQESQSEGVKNTNMDGVDAKPRLGTLMLIMIHGDTKAAVACL